MSFFPEPIFVVSGLWIFITGFFWSHFQNKYPQNQVLKLQKYLESLYQSDSLEKGQKLSQKPLYYARFWGELEKYHYRGFGLDGLLQQLILAFEDLRLTWEQSLWEVSVLFTKAYLFFFLGLFFFVFSSSYSLYLHLCSSLCLLLAFGITLKRPHHWLWDGKDFHGQAIRLMDLYLKSPMQGTAFQSHMKWAYEKKLFIYFQIFPLWELITFISSIGLLAINLNLSIKF